MKRGFILGLALTASLLFSLSSLAFALEKAVFRDPNYSLSWMNADLGDTIADYFKGKGYQVLDANQLKSFMEARIQDRKASVIIFANDVVPETVVPLDANNVMGRGEDWGVSWNLLVKYLNHGGKIVYLADWPAYYVALTDGGRTGGSDVRASVILNYWFTRWGYHDVNQPVQITEEGKKWGLTKPWNSLRGVAATDVDVVLALAAPGNAAGRVKYYTFGRPGSGLVFLYDKVLGAGEFDDEDLAQIQKVAEYFPEGEGNVSATIKGSVKTASGPLKAATLSVIGPVPTGFVPVPTDDKGEFSIGLAPGTYTIKVPVIGVEGGSVTVTVGANETKTLSIEVTPLPTIELSTANGAKYFFKKAVPLPIEPSAVDPATKEDTTWEEADSSGRQSFANGGSECGPFWIRGHFDLPADFPLDRYALLHSFDLDARTSGIFVNGVPIGNQITGNDVSQNVYLIPDGVLKRTGNVVVFRGWNGGGDMGLSPNQPKLSAGSSKSGAIYFRAKGTPWTEGGVYNGIEVRVRDAQGNLVARKTTTHTGTAFFLDLDPGTYTVEAEGVLIDRPGFRQQVTVTAGKATQVEASAVPSLGLSTHFLSKAEEQWYAKGDVDPSDLSPTRLDFKPGSEWELTAAGRDLRGCNWNEEGNFSENSNYWMRLVFTVPAEWKGWNRDLVLDDLKVDDNDVTYFNGTKIGAHEGWNDFRVYKIGKDLVRWGEKNVLAILVYNGGGPGGIQDQTIAVRLHVEQGEAVAPPPVAVAVCGDANGDGKVAVADAILALQVAVGTRKATDAQLAALDLNGDGRVTIAEVIPILRKAVNPAFALTGKNCK